MPEADIAHLSTQALILSGVVGFFVGVAMRRSRFCTMGAIADLVTMADWTRMRQWAVALAVALLCTQGLAAAGLIRLEDSLYTAPRWTPLAHLVGGLMFGLGMVLASGCATRCLLRAASGSLKALVTLIITGLTAFMTLRGVFATLRTAIVEHGSFDLGVAQDGPSLLSHLNDWPLAWTHLGLGVILGGGLLIWGLRATAVRRPAVLLPTVLIGAAIGAMWFISGHWAFLAEHPDTLAPAYLGTHSGRLEALSYVAPLAHGLDLLLFWTDKRTVLTSGVAATLGLFAGGLYDALRTRSFRWEGFYGLEDTTHHLLGGTLMGIGAVTALGCSVGQGLSGMSTLSLGSLVTLAGMILGAFAALYWQSWRTST